MVNSAGVSLMIGRIPAILMNVAAASGLVSFMSFAYSFYKDVKFQESSYNQTWQEGEIYGIVFENSPGGVKFPEILQQLNTRIATIGVPLGMSLEPATNESLRRALIGLTEKGIVKLRDDHTYAVPMDPAPKPSDALLSGGPVEVDRS